MSSLNPIQWDLTSERFYETGVDHGVLYQHDNTDPGNVKQYAKAFPWNGLVNVNETPGGDEANPIYADNIKYLNLLSAPEFAATVEAYTYPKEFELNDGSFVQGGMSIGQQRRHPFGMSYRTLIGNDVDGNDHAYKIHLIYNALAAPSEKAYSTVNDSPEPITFSWELSTTPIPFSPEILAQNPNLKPTAQIVIDSRKVDKGRMKALEDILYGVGTAARLPLPSEVFTMFADPLSEPSDSSDEEA